MALNTNYLQSNRGICKIMTIIIGLAVSSILCSNWHGGRNCFDDGRLGFISGLNFVMIVTNIIVFVLNLLNVQIRRIEAIYSLVGTVLFVIASCIAVWFVITNGFHSGWLVGTMVGMIALAGLFLWDYKILHGEASNTHLPI